MDSTEDKKLSRKDDPDFVPAKPLKILLQPEEKEIEVFRRDARTVKRLLQYLNIKPQTAIVVRNNTLLTPDLQLFSGDELLVRKIQSTG